MVAEDRCRITELTRDQCAHCRLLDLPPTYLTAFREAMARPDQFIILGEGVRTLILTQATEQQLPYFVAPGSEDPVP